MVEVVLGNKLKINSIDIIPSNINHNNEFLKVAEDESKYELISNNEVINDLSVSYEKNAALNNGSNNLIELTENLITYNISENLPLIVTFPNKHKVTFTNLNSLSYSSTTPQNLFLKENGETYLIDNNIYHQIYTPLNPNVNDIWYDLSHEPLQVYQYNNSQWNIFNDVFLGVINSSRTIIDSSNHLPVIINPYNNNFTTKNIDSYWIIENISITTPITIVSHNLNINDVSKYKASASLICIAEDNGYSIGDIINIKTFLSKSEIGCGDFNIINKSTNTVGTITPSSWKIIFKIREL